MDKTKVYHCTRLTGCISNLRCFNFSALDLRLFLSHVAPLGTRSPFELMWPVEVIRTAHGKETHADLKKKREYNGLVCLNATLKAERLTLGFCAHVNLLKVMSFSCASQRCVRSQSKGSSLEHLETAIQKPAAVWTYQIGFAWKTQEV